MINYEGRKVKMVSYPGDDDSIGDTFYGAKIGDVITLCNHPRNMPGSSVWAKPSENPGIFNHPNWQGYEHLCLCNNEDELQEYFEGVV